MKALGVDAKHPLSKLMGANVTIAPNLPLPLINLLDHMSVAEADEESKTPPHTNKNVINRVLGLRFDP